MPRRLKRRLTSPEASTSPWLHALNFFSSVPLTCPILIPCTNTHLSGTSASFWIQSLQLKNLVCCELVALSLLPPPPLSLSPPLSPLLLSSLSLILSKSNSSTLGLCFTYIIHMQMILRSVFSTSMTTSPSASTAMSVGHSLRSTNCCSLSSSVSAYSWMTTKSTW